jgi:hypothetical protein
LKAKELGVDPPELKDLPDQPPELHTVLPLFRRLSARRPYEQGIPLPIKHSEMLALIQVEGRRAGRWEIEAIELLDTIFLSEQSKARQLASR